MEVITGEIPVPAEVIGLLHSCITWATTAITPIMDEITVTINPVMINTEADQPMCFFILYIMVLPVTIVILLIAISRTRVNKQDRNSAQVNDIPYLAPATTMDVTLPVPITYPTINNPGRIESMNFLYFADNVISYSDKSQYIKKSFKN